jgi:hypothetical protein
VRPNLQADKAISNCGATRIWGFYCLHKIMLVLDCWMYDMPLFLTLSVWSPLAPRPSSRHPLRLNQILTTRSKLRELLYLFRHLQDYAVLTIMITRRW